MNKYLLPLLILLVLLFAAFDASAGDFYEIIVAADNRGVNAYNVPRGRNLGILYNGYTDDNVAYAEEISGWFPLTLTDDFSVYIHEKTAEAAWPEHPDEMSFTEWGKQLPCSAFIGQLIEDGAVMRSKPDKRSRAVARHAAGSQFLVWGEFGAYYYVTNKDTGYNSCSGFISQSSILKMCDLNYEAANHWWNSKNTPCVDHRTVHCEAGGVFASDSAVRISERERGFFRDGDTADIVAYLPNGWVQLVDGSFLDGRYLDAEGNHSPEKTAVIKTSKVLNRLNVRYDASHDAGISAKLCSGVRVEVISETEDWAVICLVGQKPINENGRTGVAIGGLVQKKYLASAGTSVPDGTVRARALMALEDDAYREKAVCAGEGTIVSVIGTDDSAYHGHDRLLLRMEDGTQFWIDHTGEQLEPISYPDVKVKTSTKATLRSAPKADAEALMTLRSGTRVQVLLRGESWTMVKYQDKTGYIYSKYLKFP